MRKVNILKNSSLTLTSLPCSKLTSHVNTCLDNTDIALCPAYCQCNFCMLKSFNHSLKPNNVDLSEFIGQDLEELVYSVVLLIVEGRTFTQVDKESQHANIIINSLLNKVNPMIKKNPVRISNDSQLKSSDQPVMHTQHSCSNKNNIQVGKFILFRNSKHSMFDYSIHSELNGLDYH